MSRDEEFSRFVEARRSQLRRLAYGLDGDWHRADDVVQNALVKLYLHWPAVRRAGNEEAYVRTVVLRTYIDETRRPWRRERPAADPWSGTEPAHGGADGDLPPLWELLQGLPVQQRACVLLRYWLDLSVAQTALELGITEGTVKSNASRGVAAIRAALVATSGDEGGA